MKARRFFADLEASGMSQIHPAWIEHQRKRFARPDAKLWVRPDATGYCRPAHYATAKSAGTFSESPGSGKQATHLQFDADNAAELRRLHFDLLSLRGELYALKFQRLLRKALHPGGGPDASAGLLHYLTQPRVPPGNPDGGQWTDDPAFDIRVAQLGGNVTETGILTIRKAITMKCREPSTRNGDFGRKLWLCLNKAQQGLFLE